MFWNIHPYLSLSVAKFRPVASAMFIRVLGNPVGA